MIQDRLLLSHGALNGNEVMLDYLDDNHRRLKRELASASELKRWVAEKPIWIQPNAYLFIGKSYDK